MASSSANRAQSNNIFQAHGTSNQASGTMQPVNASQDGGISYPASRASQASTPYHVSNSVQLNTSYQGYGAHQALTSSQTFNDYLTSSPYQPISSSQSNISYQGRGRYRVPNSSQLQDNYLSSSPSEPTQSYLAVNHSPRKNLSATTNVSHAAHRFQGLNSSRPSNPYHINSAHTIDVAGVIGRANAINAANAANLYQATNSYLTGIYPTQTNTYVSTSSPQLTTPCPPVRTLEDYIRANILPKPNIPPHNPYTNPLFPPTQAYTQAQTTQAQIAQAEVAQTQVTQAQSSTISHPSTPSAPPCIGKKYWSHTATIELIRKEMRDRFKVNFPHLEDACIGQMVEVYMKLLYKKNARYEDEEYLDIFGYKKFIGEEGEKVGNQGEMWTKFGQGSRS